MRPVNTTTVVGGCLYLICLWAAAIIVVWAFYGC